MKGSHWHWYNMKKRFCFLQEKVLSFGPNRTVEVRSNNSAEPNVWSVTNSLTNGNRHLYNYRYVIIYLPETWFKLVQRATKIEYGNSLRHIFDPESHRSLTALNYWKKKMMQWGEKSNFAEQSWFLCVKCIRYLV